MSNYLSFGGLNLFYPVTKYKYLNSSLCIHQAFYYMRPPLYEKINGSYPAGCKYDGKDIWDVKYDVNDRVSYCDE
jgi:hypothetical protein